MNRHLFILSFVLSSCVNDSTPDVPLPAPTVTTEAASEVGDSDGNPNTTAVLVTGSINGYSQAHGVCTNTIPITCYDLCSTVCDLTAMNREPKDGALSFNVLVEGLTPATTYYFKTYAYNASGEAEGEELSITTDPIFDIDGNGYGTVVIGNQVWLTSNLKTAHYNNGDPIGTPGPDWGLVTTTAGGWCYYNDDPAMNDAYGRLYNWFAVTDPRNICPAGWHAAADIEWDALFTELGGPAVAGGKLKEAGLAHWNSPNTDATNSSGFTGLPGGNRRGADNSIYETEGDMGRFWTSTAVTADAALGIDLVHNAGNVAAGLTNQFNKRYGFSVRCVMD